MNKQTASDFTCHCECHVNVIYPRNVNIVYKKACDHCNPKFSAEDINKALLDIADIEERAMIHFILLGELAAACKQNRQAYVEVIEMALPSTALTYEVKSLFKTWQFREMPFGYEYDFIPPLKWDIKIPVKIYVYKQKFKFFDSPDRSMYVTEGFNIPNPFEKYWPLRHLVRAKLERGEALSSQQL